MPEDDIYVGKDLGWQDLDTGPAAVEKYIAVTDDDHEWYRSASPFGSPVLPATFFHFQAFRHNPGWFPSDTYGTLFARERWQWCRPLLKGQPARSHAWLSEIQRKGERWHITTDVDIYDSQARIALRTRTTQTFLVESSFRGTVRSPDQEKLRRTSPPRPPEAGDSTEFKAFRKLVTVEMCSRFFGGARNYHTDVGESKKMGFGDIVVGGPMSVCYMGRMLTENLGPDIFTGADLDIRFVDVLWPNMEIVIAGRRSAEPIAEFGRERFPFRVEVCDPAGRTTVVASGSYARKGD